MTNKFEKEIQGIAIYLELRKPNATCQILITPDGFTTSAGVTNSQFFRRTITSGVTKRKWRAFSMQQRGTQKDDLQSGMETTRETALETAVTRSRSLSDYFESLVRGGYKLVNDTPIYVEVTKEDLDVVSNGNLPTKLWSRVKSSRVALGFPEETVNPTIYTTPAPTPATPMY